MSKICKECGNEYGGIVCRPCARNKLWNDGKRDSVIKRLFTPRILQDLEKYASPSRTKLAKRLVQRMMNAEGQGAYIYYDETRSGKTLLAAEMVIEWRRLKYMEAKMPATEFTTLSNILTQYEESKRHPIDFSRIHDPEISLYKRYSEVPLLVLDDFGIEQFSKGRVYEDIYAIINYRYEYLLPTIFTSNQSPSALLDQFEDARIPSRVGRMCAVVIEYHYQKGAE